MIRKSNWKRIWLIAALLVALLVSASFAYSWLFDASFDESRLGLRVETREVLESPDEFVIYSLDPVRVSADRAAGKELFHEYVVLGKSVVKDQSQRDEVVRAMYKGIVQGRDLEYAAACFNPRHGIRATRQGKVVELVICFECLAIDIYAEGETGVQTTAWGQWTFNHALRRARLPLAEN